MLKTFKVGGVHPPENKLSAGKKIEVLPIPKTVFIPVAQHIGAPSTAVVNKGDVVKTGQIIAKSSGFVSTNIHSSVSGKVKKLTFPLTAQDTRNKVFLLMWMATNGWKKLTVQKIW
jgi:Na+-translocating ferredoxin:NAD+ oxidoreductase subunit C